MAHFAVVAARVGPGKNRAVENALRSGEVDSVLGNVDSLLGIVPFEVHLSVCIVCKYAQCNAIIHLGREHKVYEEAKALLAA